MGGRCTMTQNNPTCHFASTLSLLPWVDEEYPNKYTNKVFIAFLLCNLYGLFWNQRACFSNIACRIQLIRLFMFHAGIHFAPPDTQLVTSEIQIFLILIPKKLVRSCGIFQLLKYYQV